MQIGDAIMNGADDRILYQEGTSLAESANLVFDGSDLILAGGNAAYGSGWNGSSAVPTRDAVYDIMEVLFGNRIYRSRFASLSAALTAANGKQLVITSQETISADLDTTGSNAHLILEGDGSFSVDAGKTLTLGSGFEAPESRVFFGDGVVKVVKSEIRLIWWSGQVNATIESNHWDGIIGSLTLVGGGTLIAPFGRYFTAGGQHIPACSTVKGAGNHPDSAAGTVFELTSDDEAVFIVSEGSNTVQFEDFSCDLENVTDGVGIKLTGSYPYSSFQVGFNRVGFHSGIVGIDIVDAAQIWEIEGVNVTHCNFQYQTIACFRVGSVNGSYYLEQNIFHPADNAEADAVQLNYAGTLTAVNNTILGNNVDPAGQHSTVSAYDPSTGIWTFTANHALPASPTPHAILWQVSAGSLPSTFATETIYYARNTGAATATMHPTALDAYNNTNKITGGGTGTLTTIKMRTTVPVTVDRPRAAFNVTAPHANICLINNQMEGLPYFLLVSDVYDTSLPITLINNVMQGLVKVSSNTTIVSIGNNLPSRAYEDDSTGDLFLFSYGDKFATVSGVVYDSGSTANTGVNIRIDNFIATGSRVNPQNVALGNGYFLSSYIDNNDSKIGFHEDLANSQKAIRFTPHGLGGYFKLFNNPNGGNEDLYFQVVPESGGETRFDSYLAALRFSVTGTEAFRLDTSANPIFARPLQMPTFSDASAPNNSLYYSSTQNALVYKDTGGTANKLYP